MIPFTSVDTIKNWTDSDCANKIPRIFRALPVSWPCSKVNKRLNWYQRDCARGIPPGRDWWKAINQGQLMRVINSIVVEWQRWKCCIFQRSGTKAIGIVFSQSINADVILANESGSLYAFERSRMRLNDWLTMRVNARERWAAIFFCSQSRLCLIQITKCNRRLYISPYRGAHQLLRVYFDCCSYRTHKHFRLIAPISSRAFN